MAGLNRELDDVRGQTLGRWPLPATRNIFAEVKREESHWAIMLKKGLIWEPKCLEKFKKLDLARDNKKVVHYVTIVENLVINEIHVGICIESPLIGNQDRTPKIIATKLQLIPLKYKALLRAMHLIPSN